MHYIEVSRRSVNGYDPAIWSIEVTGINPSGPELIVNHDLYLPESVAHSLRYVYTRDDVYEERGGKHFFNRAYADEHIELYLLRESTPFRIRVRLGAFNRETHGGYRWRSEGARIPLMGDVSAFPNDWYALRIAGGTVLPEPLALVRDASNAFYIPHILRLSLGSNLRGFRALYEAKTEGTGEGLLIGNDYVEFQRNPREARFINSLKFWAPGVVAIYGWLLIFSRKSTQIELASGVTGAAGIAVSLLPLREIVVPGDVAGLTRLDAWLGLAIALALSTMFYRIVVALTEADTVKKEESTHLRGDAPNLVEDKLEEPTAQEGVESAAIEERGQQSSSQRRESATDSKPAPSETNASGRTLDES